MHGSDAVVRALSILAARGGSVRVGVGKLPDQGVYADGAPIGPAVLRQMWARGLIALEGGGGGEMSIVVTAGGAAALAAWVAKAGDQQVAGGAEPDGQTVVAAAIPSDLAAWVSERAAAQEVSVSAVITEAVTASRAGVTGADRLMGPVASR